MTDCGTLIIGQGIAGTTLAWQLHLRGLPFLIVDANEPSTSSKVAAGLITPITGKRFALSWRIEELLPAATRFYDRISELLGEPMFLRKSIVRLFQNEAEREQFLQKSHTFGNLARWPVELNSDWFEAPHGGFVMPDAGHLRADRYLQLSRSFFGDRFAVHRVRDVDFVPTPDGLELPSLGVRCKRVVFCEGVAARSNPWLSELQFTPAKGEILTLRIPELHEDRIINRGVWLMSSGEGLYRTGSTYDRDHCDTTPTTAGRDEILSRLRAFLRLPFEVVDHVAAVRPIGDDRKPFVGFLSNHPRVGYFNGLASKGSLLAPFFANELAEQLLR